MQVPHPYLDESENAAAALYRLLQLLPNDMQETEAYDFNEAQLAEAIAFQAKRVWQTAIRGIEALQTAGTDLLALPGMAALLVHLENEADVCEFIAAIYRQMAEEFFRNNPEGIDSE